MAYFMMERDNPLEFIKPFLTGYLSVFPLSETALDILYYVVLGRLAQSYIIGKIAVSNYLDSFPYAHVIVYINYALNLNSPKN